MKSKLAWLQLKLDQFVTDPELPEIELMRKKVAFDWAKGTLISVIILTALAYVIGANIIGHFGMVLLVIFSFQIPLYRSKYFDFYQALFLAMIIITAFVFILIFGGYTNSAGLVFVGLTCAISSTLNKYNIVPFLLMGLYVLTILALAFLDPYLTKHPDITTSINFSFFIINTIWISAVMMLFISGYLKDRNKYQLAETNRLRELDEVKSQLFTNITHEFRTPITLIDGMATQINSPDHQIRDAVALIRSQSKRLLRLVNQILDLARIDSRSMHLHLVQADMVEFLKYHVESFRSAAEAKGINYTLKMDEDSVMMDFDPEKLETIIVNLINNAIKFTPKGGSVAIKIFKPANDKLTFEVSDTGIGIDKDDQAKVFQRFYQVKNDKYLEGNGIGLTIVKEFVHMMGGKIDLRSEVGVGSSFQITLQITNQSAIGDILVHEDRKSVNKIEDAEDDGADQVKKPSLLIIDDNPDIIQYLTKLLKRNYQIIVASDGREGFEIAKENVPDIIISDVMMPALDGFEFLKLIKSHMATSHIPVLMLTAKADRDSRLEGLELGAEAYLVKPFDKEELFIRLKKLLDLRKALHKRFQSLIPDDGPSIESDMEDRFISSVRSVLEKHLDDENFNIQTLCLEIGMSHTQLYRKFSAVTDLTVNKYIRQYRLDKAKDLLLNTSLNISQIALEVGMPNLAYFSRVFTEEFHVNPSKVRSKKTVRGDAE